MHTRGGGGGGGGWLKASDIHPKSLKKHLTVIIVSTKTGFSVKGSGVGTMLTCPLKMLAFFIDGIDAFP